MAFKRQLKCKVCTQIYAEAGDIPDRIKTSRLYKLINQYHLKGTTLQAISDEYGLRYLGVRNHALKHQNPSAKALVQKAKKEITQRAKYDQVQVMRKHNDVRSGLIGQLEEAFQRGDVKPTLAGLVSLLKQEADIEEKQKDRQFEMAKMVAKYQSGELQSGTTRRITDSSN